MTQSFIDIYNNLLHPYEHCHLGLLVGPAGLIVVRSTYTVTVNICFSVGCAAYRLPVTLEWFAGVGEGGFLVFHMTDSFVCRVDFVVSRFESLAAKRQRDALCRRLTVRVGALHCASRAAPMVPSPMLSSVKTVTPSVSSTTGALSTCQ